MTEKVFVVVWEFDIRADAEAEFLRGIRARMETGLGYSVAGTGFYGLKLARSIARAQPVFHV